MAEERAPEEGRARERSAEGGMQKKGRQKEAWQKKARQQSRDGENKVPIVQSAFGYDIFLVE